MRVLGIGNHLPFNIHLQIGANGQYGRCNFQRASVMEAFKMRGKEKGRIVEFGKGVGGFDDGIAKAFQNGLVERVEDGVLENDVSDVVSRAWRSGLAWVRKGRGGGGGGERQKCYCGPLAPP